MAEVDLDINVNAKVDKNFKGIENQLAKTEKAADGAAKSFGGLSKSILGAGAALATFGAGLSFAIDQAITIEDLTTQFIAFTGSAESAADQVERIAQLSASTPFQLEDLANANRTLLAFGSSTEESIDQLQQLGEAAAATGNNVNDLAVIFGQIQAAGKLTGERFNQLVERGINIGPALAESLGVAETELVELRMQGKITSDDVARAFESMTTGAGQFAGSMERLSKTLSGSLSTLKDNVSLLGAAIGSELTPILVEGANALSRLAKGVTAFITNAKPERLRVLNSELKELEQELKEVEEGFKTTGSGFLGFSKVSDQSKAKAAELRQEIESLKSEIVDTATGSSGSAQEESRADSKRIEQANEEAKEILETEKKLEAELEANRQSQAANRRAAARAQTEERLIFLQDEFDKLQEKEQELEVAKLENSGQFDAAIEERALQHEENLARIKEEGAREQALITRKANEDEFDLAKIQSEEEIKFAQKTNLGKARALREGLGNLVALQRTGSKEAFEIGKAAAIAQAAIAIPESALQAYKSGVGIGGPPLGAAFAAAATAAQLANLQNIQSARFTAFNEGGLVPGTGNRDNVPALLTPGEVVVPERNFNDLGMNNDQTVRELKSLNKNLEDQNQVLFNIAQNTNDTALGTLNVAAGVANINLPGQNNPGAGADYTDWNIETYAEAARILREQSDAAAADEFANNTIGNISSGGQANVQFQNE